MYITSREKAIIEFIMKTSGKHTPMSLAGQLQVSTRTVQRDLKAVENILNAYDLQLVRDASEGLSINGKNEQIFRLVQYIAGNQPIDQTPKEKKLNLLLSLLEEESYKAQLLARHLSISITTLTSYLDELTEWLDAFKISITRKRGVGIELKGTEASKRKALAAYLLHFFQDELIEQLFLLQEGSAPTEKILYYFEPESLMAIDGVLNSTFSSAHSRLADSGYNGLMVHFYITIQRSRNGWILKEEGSTEENSLIADICKQLSSVLDVSFSEDDIGYLTAILKGAKLHEANVLPYDSVVLGKLVRNLIKDVSVQLQVDLTKDFPLYQGLLAHMEPSVFRVKQGMGLYNPLTEEIKRKYPILFSAVKIGLEKEFLDIEAFPEDELAFIVLHFGSALVLREEEIFIKALIVCPTGIGTSKMLASRIKKEIHEIDSVEIKSMKDIRKNGSLKPYDVIISTVRLPFSSMDYILVSPLLTEGNVAAIRNYVRKNIESFTKKRRYRHSETAARSGKASSSLQDILTEMKDVQENIQSLLDNFRFYRMSGVGDHQEILDKMVRRAEADKLLSDSDAVIEALKEREKIGGLGIPGTQMGLFHTRNEHVQTILFQVAHLDEPCLVKGMNGEDQQLKNLLLMLVPEKLQASQQEIVSLISSSLIESKESIMDFSSSEGEVIRRRIEAVFLDYLYTNWIKG